MIKDNDNENVVETEKQIQHELNQAKTWPKPY